MSHIAQMDIEVKDLDSLKKAAKALGLQFNEGKETYKWYGYSVGDYPLPAGFSKEDLGKCEHTLSVIGNSSAYEVGIAKRRDGKKGYVLLWDFWNKGYGLQDKVGKDGNDLMKHYAAEVAMKQFKLQGFRVVKKVKADGSFVLTGEKL